MEATSYHGRMEDNIKQHIEVVAAIREGLADVAAGRTKPARERS